ncbi:MAG TPA: hypothetical protein VF699_06480 [Caulobacteraceae bacterium]
MASNFFSPDHRPDPAHWTRTNVGLTSPLWWPFLMAAGAGAAWWTYTNWGRIAATSWTGDLQQRLGDGNGGGSAGQSFAPAAASLEQSLAVQGDAEGGASDDDDDGLVDDGSDAIDAAYAANLGPVPAPKKRAAKSGGAAAKRPAAKAAARKTSAAKTPAKKTAARKTPAKTGGRRR